MRLRPGPKGKLCGYTPFSHVMLHGQKVTKLTSTKPGVLKQADVSSSDQPSMRSVNAEPISECK